MRKKLSLTILLSALLLGVFVFAPQQPVFAAENVNVADYYVAGCNPFTTLKTISSGFVTSPTTAINLLKELSNCVASFLYDFALIVGAIFILLAGIKYMLSAGDEKNQTAAKKSLESAIVGLILATAVYSIIAYYQAKIEYNTLTNEFINTGAGQIINQLNSVAPPVAPNPLPTGAFGPTPIP